MMKASLLKKCLLVLTLTLAVLAGCGQAPASGTPVDSSSTPVSSTPSAVEPETSSSEETEGSLVGTAASIPPTEEESSSSAAETAAGAADLEVQFGDDGPSFILHLEDNETAAAIARHVGTADWRLPIYHYDDYENWEVMQYYDIPSRYEIPSSPEAVPSEKAGEVYYSDPNRIVLFYQDAEVPGEYTKVGSFDFTEEFQSAVENNPVLEGWGNKIVIIGSGDN